MFPKQKPAKPAEPYLPRTLVAGFFFACLVLSGPTQAQEAIPEPTQDPFATYRLFRTQNIYMYLRLDTRTGQISHVQWSTTREGRFVSPLTDPLVEGGKPGRFTLYPTKNIYNFILLDQETGRAWQVQWGKEGVILPILQTN